LDRSADHLAPFAPKCDTPPSIGLLVLWPDLPKYVCQPANIPASVGAMLEHRAAAQLVVRVKEMLRYGSTVEADIEQS